MERRLRMRICVNTYEYLNGSKWLNGQFGFFPSKYVLRSPRTLLRSLQALIIIYNAPIFNRKRHYHTSHFIMYTKFCRCVNKSYISLPVCQSNVIWFFGLFNFNTIRNISIPLNVSFKLALKSLPFKNRHRFQCSWKM